MKLTRHNERFSSSYTLFGRQNGYNVNIIYNSPLNKYYFYLKDRKSNKSYYSPHQGIYFDNEEECINACMEKLKEIK